MIINCLGSGSKGNCFFITNTNGEILILDAGIKWNKVIAHKRFTSCRNVVGALVTHFHKDHSLSTLDFFKAGISVYSYANIEPKKKYLAGSYEFMPFLCPHDGVINYGFVIKDKCENKTLVYATDTTALPIIKDVDAWLVECNYTMEKWEENVAKSTDNLQYFGRVLNSHMSLGYLTKFFSNGEIKPSQAIILCHLSENGNADKEAMTAAIKPFTKMVDIALKGKEWVV